MVANPLRRLRFESMAGHSVEWQAGPELEQTRAGAAEILSEAMGLNLPENADSIKQHEILDALPVLIFLERAGKIVFANAEARLMLGLTEGEWVPRPRRRCAVGTVSRNRRAADAADGHRNRQPVSRHHAGKKRQADAG